MHSVVSIIIPVFNRLKYLPVTFNSVFEQTYKFWEIIAVDDGSTDGSYEWLIEMSNKDKRIITLKNNSGIKGPSAARNLGIEYSNSKFIIFLDSDDLLENLCLEQRLKIMNSEQELSYAIFKQNTFIEDSRILSGLYNSFPRYNESFLDLFLRNDNPWQTMAVIWKRSTLIKLKGFDINFIMMEDPELHTRALLDSELKFRFCYELPPDTLYRIGNMDGLKSDTFFHDSISYRFLYLKKTLPLVGFSNLSKQQKKNANKNWTLGLWNLFSKFLLSRIKFHYQETLMFLKWAEINQGLSYFDILKARLFVTVWYNEWVMIRFLKLRGFLYFIFFR
jgi:glycosyltransferase involved in cell wall biosynthesis